MASTTSYIINFNKKTGVFTLTSTKDEVKVDAKHKKYEWLKSQEAGRIVKISDKGRWNSSKDYIGLYDEINSSKSKKKKTSTVGTKTKSVDDKSSEVNELKTQLKELKTSNNKLKTENAELKKSINTWRNLYNLARKEQREKPIKKTEKKVVWRYWEVKIMATESYTSGYPYHKYKNECSIYLYTHQLNEKPTKSYI
jgi:regulator of replication initiation timing